MAENKITLSKSDRKAVCLRHQFLQGSWNYERMQNGGWCFSMIPAIKKLYPNKEDQAAALKRHLEFYNTHLTNGTNDQKIIGINACTYHTYKSGQNQIICIINYHTAHFMHQHCPDIAQ